MSTSDKNCDNLCYKLGILCPLNDIHCCKYSFNNVHAFRSNLNVHYSTSTPCVCGEEIELHNTFANTLGLLNKNTNINQICYLFILFAISHQLNVMKVINLSLPRCDECLTYNTSEDANLVHALIRLFSLCSSCLP